MSFEEYTQELLACETKWDMLQYIIEIGKELPKVSDSIKIKENQIPGCISQAYIDVQITENHISINGTADSHIIKGFIKIFKDSIETMTLEEFDTLAEKKIQEFISKTKIDSSHISSRANSFGNIYSHIKKKRIELEN